MSGPRRRTISTIPGRGQTPAHRRRIGPRRLAERGGDVGLQILSSKLRSTYHGLVEGLVEGLVDAGARPIAAEAPRLDRCGSQVHGNVSAAAERSRCTQRETIKTDDSESRPHQHSEKPIPLRTGSSGSPLAGCTHQHLSTEAKTDKDLQGKMQLHEDRSTSSNPNRYRAITQFKSTQDRP